MTSKQNTSPVCKGSDDNLDIADVTSAIEAWLEDNKEAPELVKIGLRAYLDLIKTFGLKAQKTRSLLAELRKSYGIDPKSERRRSGTNKPSRKKRKQTLEEEIRDSKLKARKHERNGRKQRDKIRDLEKQLKDIEEIELSEEQEAQAEKDADEFVESVQIGNRCDLDCVLPTETLIPNVSACYQEESVVCELPTEGTGDYKQAFTENRVRYDFSIQVTKLNIEVEKAKITNEDGEEVLVSASTAEIGPPRMKVTWGFLTNMSILTSQYAMPFNRFATLLTNDEVEFKGSEIAKYFQYVALRFLSIYIYLGKSCGNMDNLSGDDTSSRVLEITKNQELEKKTWTDYATIEKANEFINSQDPTKKVKLGHKIAAVFGFEHKRKDGKGSKKALNVSVVSGRTDPFDPKSTIVFYRSHIGGLGNLLESIFQYRDPDKKKVTIQADLATVNLLPEDTPWEATIAGCVSHARRRFVKHQDDSPIGESMVQLFSSLYFHEDELNLYGRNSENTNAVRGKTSKRFWEWILEDCQETVKKWSKETGLGEAARFVIKHFDKLTYYLKDPRVSMTNDLSERLLRMEDLIEDNAHFRMTLEGRFALDIMRTILQTAVASKSSVPAYLEWVLQSDPEDVEKNPQNYTPYAYLKAHPGATQDH